MNPLIIQKHTPEQQDRDGWKGWNEQLRLGAGGPNKTFPNDMGQRGFWTFEDTMSYCPYSQFSCGVGVANLYTVNHAKRLEELTKTYGKIFIYTVSRSKDLRDYVMSHPEHHVVLAEQESWMDQCPIYIMGSKT
jgi:hypothetical protein